MDIRPLIAQTSEIIPSKVSEPEARLNINELLQIYKINSELLNPMPKAILVFDAILTRGTHFKAAKKLLQDTYANVPIAGLFIAQAAYPEY